MDLAAGKRHTLFVSDDGLVFSVGEGLRWQLGTTSQFINHPERQAIQRLPKQVTGKNNSESRITRTEECFVWLSPVSRENSLHHIDTQKICRIGVQYSVQVHPSGHLKAGKDYWVAQAAAGDTFSVTREANWEDAARATEGFLWMKEVPMGSRPKNHLSTV